MPAQGQGVGASIAAQRATRKKTTGGPQPSRAGQTTSGRERPGPVGARVTQPARAVHAPPHRTLKEILGEYKAYRGPGHRPLAQRTAIAYTPWQVRKRLERMGITAGGPGAAPYTLATTPAEARREGRRGRRILALSRRQFGPTSGGHDIEAIRNIYGRQFGPTSAGRDWAAIVAQGQADWDKLQDVLKGYEGRAFGPTSAGYLTPHVLEQTRAAITKTQGPIKANIYQASFQPGLDPVGKMIEQSAMIAYGIPTGLYEQQKAKWLDVWDTLHGHPTWKRQLDYDTQMAEGIIETYHHPLRNIPLTALTTYGLVSGVGGAISRGASMAELAAAATRGELRPKALELAYGKRPAGTYAGAEINVSTPRAVANVLLRGRDPGERWALIETTGKHPVTEMILDEEGKPLLGPDPRFVQLAEEKKRINTKIKDEGITKTRHPERRAMLDQRLQEIQDAMDAMDPTPVPQYRAFPRQQVEPRYLGNYSRNPLWRLIQNDVLDWRWFNRRSLTDLLEGDRRYQQAVERSDVKARGIKEEEAAEKAALREAQKTPEELASPGGKVPGRLGAAAGAFGRGLWSTWRNLNQLGYLGMLQGSPAYAQNILATALTLGVASALGPMNMLKAVHMLGAPMAMRNRGIMAKWGLDKAATQEILDRMQAGGLSESLLAESGGLGPVNVGNVNRWIATKIWGPLVDRYQRTGAFMHEAGRKGFHSKEDIQNLLTQPELRDMLNDITIRANNAMVDFSRLSRREREIGSAVAFYPWLKASAIYMPHVLREHPIKAAKFAQMGALGQQINQQNLGDLPSFMLGSTMIGHKNIPGFGRVPTVSNFAALNPFTTVPDLLMSLRGIFQPGPRKFALSELASPGAQALIAGLFHYDPFRQAQYPPEMTFSDIMLDQMTGNIQVADWFTKRITPPEDQTKNLYLMSERGWTPGAIRALFAGTREPRALNVPVARKMYREEITKTYGSGTKLEQAFSNVFKERTKQITDLRAVRDKMPADVQAKLFDGNRLAKPYRDAWNRKAELDARMARAGALEGENGGVLTMKQWRLRTSAALDYLLSLGMVSKDTADRQKKAIFGPDIKQSQLESLLRRYRDAIYGNVLRDVTTAVNYYGQK